MVGSSASGEEMPNASEPASLVGPDADRNDNIMLNSSVSRVGETSSPLYSLEWRYSIYGNSIGSSGISVADIDGDSTVEMVMSAHGGSGSFWYIVEQTGENSFEQVWWSDVYSAGIRRIVVADVDTNGIAEIYVGLSDNRVFIYDGLTLEEVGRFFVDGEINAMVIADVDADGRQEIITSNETMVFVYSTYSFNLEWASTTYGGRYLAVGNVDADPAPEIVLTCCDQNGYVIDGVSHDLEWEYMYNFGSKFALLDVDGDGMSEIMQPMDIRSKPIMRIPGLLAGKYQ
jgi:hypothetical protein